MKYKINERTKDNQFLWDEDNVKFLLYNNGIDDVDAYMDFHKEYDCSKLMNIDKGYEMYYSAIKNGKRIGILVDSDFDGLSSASIMYRYSKLISPTATIVCLVREGKKHGLSQEVYDFVDNNKLDLLIVPDAQCDSEWSTKIIELNCSLLVLDHHETKADIYSDDLKANDKFVIINPNQEFDCYPNKSLSGCAVVYKFLQYCDSMMGFDFAHMFIPMVAISLLADSMDMTSSENRYLVTCGLPHINEHPFVEALIKKQEYSLKGKTELVPMDVSFYIIPLINAVVRIGSIEECEKLFKAFCEEYEEFEYTKRGETESVLESIYEHCARMCTNVKNRQGRIRDKDLEYINSLVKLNKLDNNKLIIVNAEGLINTNLTGLTAMKVAEKNRTPVLIVNHYHDDILGGSGRNFDNSYIDDLKAFLNESGLVEMAEGHANAQGIQIKEENIPKLIEYANDKLASVDTHIAQTVDVEIDFEDLDINLFLSLEDSKEYVANNIKPLNYVIKNIPLNLANGMVMGKNKDSWKCSTDIDNITCLKFSSENDIIIDYLNNLEYNVVMINAIATLTMNEYNGLLTPQIIISDYEIVGDVVIDREIKETDDDEWSELWES